MKSNLYEVTLGVTPNLPLYHGSKVISGLHELARQRLIVLRTPSLASTQIMELTTTTKPTELPPSIKTEEPIVPGWTMYMEIRSPVGRAKTVILDFHDRADMFAARALAFADVYFKRSLSSVHTAMLPPQLRSKIIPFGLNFGCVNRSSRVFFLNLALKKFISRIFRSPRQQLQALFQDLNLIRVMPPASAFEHDDSTPRDATVLYQTRVWPPEESTEDLSKVNTERVLLVRTLREAFGDRFVGGIVDSVFARQFSPDVLTDGNIRRKLYAHLCQKGMIGVYTRGLHQSHAFKLSEYLAAGLCIVSEPLVSDLPQLLEPDVHYLPFTNPGECIGQCRRLLENPDEATRMSQANIRYYREFVEPQSHVRGLLDRTFEESR
jgi:hypothetical protein